jgi:hypothetical protein
MLERGNLRINNTSVCRNEITWESITHQYARMRSPDVLLILRLPHSSILMCYLFSGYLILAYWCVIDSQVTSFHHTDVLMILRWPHSTILMCYWFSGDLIPSYWCVIDSQVTSFQHTEVLLILQLPHSSILMWGNLRINNTSVCRNKVTWESITHQYARMRSPENQ